MLDLLRDPTRRIIGIKQVHKQIEKDNVQCVFVAKDAEERVLKTLLEACERMNIPIRRDHNMIELGRACGIDVGAAAVAVRNQ
jgi:large subunit ribosomal protein L7A